MKCYYTATTTILISILLIITSIESLIRKNSRPLTIIYIGIILYLVALDSGGIGIFMNDTMPCNKTKCWIQVPAIVISILGAYTAYKNKNSID